MCAALSLAGFMVQAQSPAYWYDHQFIQEKMKQPSSYMSAKKQKKTTEAREEKEEKAKNPCEKLYAEGKEA